VLEPGGYNPPIVLADADLDYAVEATALASFFHQSQIYMSARRIHARIACKVLPLDAYVD
jgi:acyl-CoA reductase-like NAD-dependent aldehyde dehydrogenase